jgi:hypothetical protein
MFNRGCQQLGALVSFLDEVQIGWERHGGYGESFLMLLLSPCLVIFSDFAQVVISLRF